MLEWDPSSCGLQIFDWYCKSKALLLQQNDSWPTKSRVRFTHLLFGLQHAGQVAQEWPDLQFAKNQIVDEEFFSGENPRTVKDVLTSLESMIHKMNNEEQNRHKLKNRDTEVQKCIQGKLRSEGHGRQDSKRKKSDYDALRHRNKTGRVDPAEKRCRPLK
jgi:hypothetical protein